MLKQQADQLIFILQRFIEKNDSNFDFATFIASFISGLFLLGSVWLGTKRYSDYIKEQKMSRMIKEDNKIQVCIWNLSQHLNLELKDYTPYLMIKDFYQDYISEINKYARNCSSLYRTYFFILDSLFVNLLKYRDYEFNNDRIEFDDMKYTMIEHDFCLFLLDYIRSVSYASEKYFSYTKKSNKNLIDEEGQKLGIPKRFTYTLIITSKQGDHIIFDVRYFIYSKVYESIIKYNDDNLLRSYVLILGDSIRFITSRFCFLHNLYVPLVLKYNDNKYPILYLTKIAYRIENPFTPNEKKLVDIYYMNISTSYTVNLSDYLNLENLIFENDFDKKLFETFVKNKEIKDKSKNTLFLLKLVQEQEKLESFYKEHKNKIDSYLKKLNKRFLL